MTAIITTNISVPQLTDERRRLEGELEADLNAAADATLDDIEQAQILKYTSSAYPDRLRYERTFTLRRSSRRQTLSSKLPTITRRWYADEAVASYAKKVIGLRSEQKPIHRDRWLAEEDVEKIAQEKAEERLNAIQIR